MAKWALIISDMVHETTDEDPKDRFPSDMIWVKCAASVKQGYLYADGDFTSPGPTFEEIKASSVEALRMACEATITGGFKSSALGPVHTYPSDMKAQINLMGSVTDSIMPDLPTDWQTPFWVQDAAGLWSWKMHNAAQIQQAGRDGKAHVVSCQTLLAELTAAVLAAATAEAVASITWPEGAGA